MGDAKHLGLPGGAPTQHKPAGYILVIGQYLRDLLYAEIPSLIKDRRYHLRLYVKCFVGREIIDWLVDNEDIPDRSKVIEMMQLLLKHKVIHHVVDDHNFKDAHFFYRFLLDDNSFVMRRENEPFIKGWSLFTTLSKMEKSPVRCRTQNNISYKKSFYGNEMVDYLMKSGMVNSHQEGIILGKDLVEGEIVRHVTDEHHFKDERILYQFHPDLDSIKLSDLLTINCMPHRRTIPSSGSSTNLSSFTNQKYSHTFSDFNPKASIPRHASLPAGFEGSLQLTPQDLSLSSSELDADTKAPASVLLHHATVEELTSNDSPYIRKAITITSDSVGYGFIVRGNSPSYVQTVDPSGPAASEGLRVRQYIASVNGHACLEKSHQEIADLITKGVNQVTLEIMTHFREASKTT